MKPTHVVVSASLISVLTGCATGGDGATWKCSAKGLINSNYNGLSMAMIHLQGYGSGGSYKVDKNAAGTEAKGVTADGTPFACVKAP
jgi:hypothetical protein